MKHYADINHDSNVLAYEYWNDYIIVQFKPGKPGKRTIYRYTYATAGGSVIDYMKVLADRGTGLNSYINTHKPNFI